ncbi:MAG: hypothetical protein KME35_16920 [Aphanocapsa sp. GSE-SYN-MK-11-07L]|jgi:hypothetical protein|nr:hypothetical protein [Aphanocapsa sp. GSE-SYN-MK-11-07L]
MALRDLLNPIEGENEQVSADGADDHRHRSKTLASLLPFYPNFTPNIDSFLDSAIQSDKRRDVQ